MMEFFLGLLMSAVIGANGTQSQEVIISRPTYQVPAQTTTYGPGTAGAVVSTNNASGMISVEQNLVQRTNAARAQAGMPPLQVDHQLMASARRQAIWMARNQVMQHGNAPVAENIAAGQRSSTEAVQSWLNSPGHRANMLNGSYRRIGVAAYRSRNGQIYWCQQFVR